MINDKIEIANKDENGIGEIRVKGPNVMLGYYENEEYLKSNGSLIKEEIQKYGVVETDTTIKDFFESEKVNG